MLIIGLTGGIGSGKSTVATLFAEHGTPIIDTDQIARAVVAPGQPALQKIVDKFGATVLSAEGTLIRPHLRQLIFKHQELRLWLEDLLHPLIREKIEQAVSTIKAAYCIVVIPLLLEKEPNPLINRILVIDASEAQQRQRVAARDKTSAVEIDAILATQISREARLMAADDIIYNNASLDYLRTQVNDLHEHYLSLK